MSRHPILILAVLILTGCSSIEDVRQSDPVRSGNFPVGYKDIAACVVHDSAPLYSVSDAIFESRGLAVLTCVNEISAGFIQGREPVWELRIEGDTEGSRVEFRSTRTLVGTSPWADDVWPIVEQCGRDQHRLSSATR